MHASHRLLKLRKYDIVVSLPHRHPTTPLAEEIDGYGGSGGLLPALFDPEDAHCDTFAFFELW